MFKLYGVSKIYSGGARHPDLPQINSGFYTPSTHIGSGT